MGVGGGGGGAGVSNFLNYKSEFKKKMYGGEGGVAGG